MANQLPTLYYAQFEATRNYLQDVAKVLGKFQQVFLQPEIHEWHRGLIVAPGEIRTQPLAINGAPLLGSITLQEGVVQVGREQWRLGVQQPGALFGWAQTWLKSHGLEQPMAPPEFTLSVLSFEPRQALQLMSALAWAAERLAACKASFGAAMTSPVLLFPHHFDLAFTWFHDSQAAAASNDVPQHTYGFSTGDSTIREPYFYVTIYPEPKHLFDYQLPPPGFWQKDGFHGAVLLYKDVQTAPDPEDLLQGFLLSVPRETGK